VVVTVLPAAAPDLAPLIAIPIGTGELVLVTTSTSAPARAVALGNHRVSAEVTGAGAIAPTALQDVVLGPVTDGAGPPSDSDPGPVLVRGDRSGGHTPLAVWFTRPDAGQPAELTVRLVDPRGRLSEQQVTVPAVSDAPPSLELLDVVTIIGRGVVVRVRSDADAEVQPPYVLAVQAQQTRRPFPIGPLPRPVRARFELDDIPTRPGPFPSGEVIQAVRTTTDVPHEYQVLVRLAPPMLVTLTMLAPAGGGQSQVVAEVR
jgi:hypothetical protein